MAPPQSLPHPHLGARQDRIEVLCNALIEQFILQLQRRVKECTLFCFTIKRELR